MVTQADSPNDPYRERSVARTEFARMYDGTPPWDIGAPQPEFVRLADAGHVRGRVLDVGCGTGDNAIHLAARGFDVVGVDFVQSAIGHARTRARSEGVSPRFVVADALNLHTLGGRFDTIIDSGLFHVFSDADRARFVVSLGAVVVSGGTLLLMCFSEHETRSGGPRRVTQSEIRAAFADGWAIDQIAPARFATSSQFDGGAAAWRCIIRRT